MDKLAPLLLVFAILFFIRCYLSLKEIAETFKRVDRQLHTLQNAQLQATEDINTIASLAVSTTKKIDTFHDRLDYLFQQTHKIQTSSVQPTPYQPLENRQIDFSGKIITQENQPSIG